MDTRNAGADTGEAFPLDAFGTLEQAGKPVHVSSYGRRVKPRLSK